MKKSSRPSLKNGSQHVLDPVGGSVDNEAATLFAEAARDFVRYVATDRSWAVFDGTRWRFVDEAPVVELWNEFRTRLLVNKLDKKGEPFVADVSSSKFQASSVVWMARGKHQLRTERGEFDQRKYELNTPGGVVALRTCELLPHDASALHSRIAGMTPVFGVTPTRFLAWLDEVFLGDAELIAYVRRLLAMWVVGEVGEQILPVFFGEGANGKGALLEVLYALLSTEENVGYAREVSGDFVVKTKFPKHEAEVAALCGVRLLVVSELEASDVWNIKRVKEHSGGSRLTASFKGRDPFTFEPTHSIVVETNRFPTLETVGTAERRRFVMLPFDYEVPEDIRDRNFAKKLVAEEGPAIFGWILEDTKRYLAEGLPAKPARVVAATDSELDSLDLLQQFVQEWCEFGDDAWVSTSELFLKYQLFCVTLDEKALSNRAFRTDFTRRFLPAALATDKDPSGKRRAWKGVRLQTRSARDADPAERVSS
ncbi:DNA primase family protein [Rhodococcus sp. JS3073]|uniref:DNA primase family protein n=1 Tax=Rhodococcus sp. JS3073 TaxID=3002901 RepID=UPI002285C311|nr:phage/plasmid primase, P4 family [Rhodococcus sp. JS3073]WAM17514.1 phage/plasmid primase, P4 family [Rhodococcus sp. JS3073]